MLDSTLNGVAGTKKYNIWSTTTADSVGAGAFAIYDETGTAYRMVIGSSGNVSIGTTDTATYKLNVNGDINISSGSQFRIDGSVLSTFTPSSTNLVGSFLNTQFENVGGFIQYKS